MITLPAIEGKVLPRPGQLNGKTQHCIPDSEYLFWNEFYKAFYTHFKLTPPILGFSDKINPYFGYFGYRWHPINFQPKYFHIGIDITEVRTSTITVVYEGKLEYSGFANVNGNYMVVKHPDITTADGYVFHSLYMHCDELYASFGLVQKVMREYISKNFRFSNVEIDKGEHIATVGTTGNKLGVVPHLHLQFEFVKGDTHIVIDPLCLYNKQPFENLTASISAEAEFISFYHEHSQELLLWKKFWAHKV